MKAYMLQVHYTESFGRIYKVYTDQGVYALKSIAPEHRMDFVRHVQRLYQKGYNRAVPVYITQDGRYGVLHENRLYYLMPWLTDEESGERNEKHLRMFRELARIHTISVKEMEVDPEEREVHYDQTNELWEKQQEFAEEFAKGCERKWYMSPFELMYCSYHLDVSQALSYSLKKLKDWYDNTKEEDKVRTAVIHGKVSVRHFLMNERGFGYFINFENARQAPIHFDLLPFFVKYCNTYPIQCDQCVEWLYHYKKHFRLKEEEMLLFLSYLAYPGTMIQTLKDYSERKYEYKSEYQYVKQLQRNYWQLKNIEYLVMKIEEREAAIKAAQEAAAEQQT